MPCYEVNTISLELKTANKDLLHAAIKSLGFTITEIKNGIIVHTPQGDITIANGTATSTMRNAEDWINKVKQAYSMQTIEYVAKKYKFTVTEKPGNKITMRRYS